jgi:hypothetical protein
MPSIKSRPRCASRLSPELAAEIRPAKEAAARLRKHVGRFELYVVLEAIYSIYAEWKGRKIANRSARGLANELNIGWRKGMSPIRALIEAVKPDADFKQKSRWVRALEYIYAEDVPARRFQTFVGHNGGLAGCARLAAQMKRKRQLTRRDRPEGDWTD